MQSIVRFQRLAFWCWGHGLKAPARGIELFIRLCFGARFPAQARIHPSVFFNHNALAVILNAETAIGRGCEIGTHVVIGGNPHQSGAPILEEDVVVMTGAKILGPITVGRGAVIAANAVVLADVAPFSLAAGAPAVIKKSQIDSGIYRARHQK